MRGQLIERGAKPDKIIAVGAVFPNHEFQMRRLNRNTNICVTLEFYFKERRKELLKEKIIIFAPRYIKIKVIFNDLI